MIVLINAGGSGTRLWPLSTTALPKQFLRIVGDKSLLQTAYDRALLITTSDKIYVTTSHACSEIVAEQLPSLTQEQIITEPARRDTMACVLNAFQYISSKTSEEEVIASVWSDNYIEDVKTFSSDLIKAGKLSEKYEKMILFGIVPDKPGPKFGHIHKANQFKDEENVFEVSGFKEKPSLELAKEYQKSGEYLWNSGCFVASYKTLRKKVAEFSEPAWLKQLEKLEATTSPEARNVQYLEFDREAVDIALMERTPDLLVIPQTFSWADLGSFDDVYEINPKNKEGSVVKSTNRLISLHSDKNYVFSNGVNKPIAVVGLSRVIIVDTPDGLLVANMDHAQTVKKVSEILEE